jgi:hypothetical protein
VLTRWRRQRRCFHHDHTTGESWLTSFLIQNGMGKLFRCTRCFRAWTI